LPALISPSRTGCDARADQDAARSTRIAPGATIPIRRVFFKRADRPDLTRRSPIIVLRPVRGDGTDAPIHHMSGQFQRNSRLLT